jgi:hypothetical protein
MAESILNTSGALQIPSEQTGAAVIARFSTGGTTLIALGVVNRNVFNPCNISAGTGGSGIVKLKQDIESISDMIDESRLNESGCAGC